MRIFAGALVERVHDVQPIPNARLPKPRNAGTNARARNLLNVAAR
ncbi:hypothetical protein OKW41_003020 [Paraburkholderia sp. UCT70]